MKDKIISLIIWILVWWIIVYFYWVYTQKDNTNKLNTWINIQNSNFDPSNMSDAQLERMANRAWISIEELKQRLDNWENIRDITANSWSWFSWTWINRSWDNRTWTWFSWSWFSWTWRTRWNPNNSQIEQ